MTPELPLLAEWVGVRSGSQCSPGISICRPFFIHPPASNKTINDNCPNNCAPPASLFTGLPEGNMLPPAPLTHVTVVTGRQSQLATLHCPGRTASIAGPSIGPPLRNRCTSEGTVQVVLAGHAIPNSPRPPGVSLNHTAQPASSAAAPAAAEQRGRRRGAAEPDDSTTAISQAPRAMTNLLGAAAVPPLDDRPRPDDPPTGPAKPTDSYSSAAVNALPAAGERAVRAAASLASHHTGALGDGTAIEDDTKHSIDMPAPRPLAATAMLTPAGPRMGNGMLLTPGHAFTPLQLQSVVSAALGRAGPLAARPGDSSSSGNRPLVLVGLKRKKAPGSGAGGRPPMAPPAQIPKTGGNPQPTASSPGAAPQQADNTLAVEDAVSMVEHGLEADIEIACDAVSKASDGPEGGAEAAMVSECPSLAEPGASMASGGVASRRKEEDK